MEGKGTCRDKRDLVGDVVVVIVDSSIVAARLGWRGGCSAGGGLGRPSFGRFDELRPRLKNVLARMRGRGRGRLESLEASFPDTSLGYGWVGDEGASTKFTSISLELRAVRLSVEEAGESVICPYETCP